MEVKLNTTLWPEETEMKATIQYNLPEEREELDLALRGADYQAVVSDVDQWLRNVLKHEDPPEEVAAALQDVRDKIHEELECRSLTIW